MKFVETIPLDEISRFCRRWQIRELALFGSAIRDDFHAGSDIDILVTYDRASNWGLFDHAQMKNELEKLFGRKIDLVTRRALEQTQNSLLRTRILNTAQVIFPRGKPPMRRDDTVLQDIINAYGGKMLLRIEDTDRERSTEAAIAAILDGLKWLELDWDGDVIYQFSRTANCTRRGLRALVGSRNSGSICAPRASKRAEVDSAENCVWLGVL